MAGDSIGSVFIDLKADTSHLVAGFDRAERMAKRTSDLLVKSAGAIAVAYSAVHLKEFVDMQVESAQEASKLAQQYSIATEELTKYHYIASKAGVSTDQMNDAFKDMGDKLTKFQMEGEEAKEAFKALGITQDFAKKKMTTSSKSMEILLQKLADFPKGMHRATIAMELFGDEGSNVVRVADLGADAIKRYTEEAVRGNITLSESYAQKTKGYAEAEKRLDALSDGWADAVIEESKFLEMGESLYTQMGNSMMDWTDDVQHGNSVFVDGLESIMIGTNAVFPEVVDMGLQVGETIWDMGVAVFEASGEVAELTLEMFGLDGSIGDNITTLGSFAGYAMGATMAIENFGKLVEFGANGVQMFGVAIYTYAISRLEYMESKFYSSMGTISEWLNIISFGELGEDYAKYNAKAQKYNDSMQETLIKGNNRLYDLKKEQRSILKGVHDIDWIKSNMEFAAENVSERQREGLSKKLKKTKIDYEKMGKAGIKALKGLADGEDKAKESAKKAEKSLKQRAKAQEKLQKAQAKALEDRLRIQEQFNDEYNRSTLTSSEYEKLQLEKKLHEYESAQVDKIRLDKWYQTELSKINDTEAKEDAYKEYLQITNQKEKLFDIDTEATLKKFEDLGYSIEQLDEIEDTLWQNFAENGLIAVEAVEKKASALQEIFSILSNEAKQAGLDILHSYSQTGDIQGSIQAYTESGQLSNTMMNSGSPQLATAAITAEIISGALTKPLSEEQAMLTNIHMDNKSIGDSLSILESVADPQLMIARESEQHLRNIQNSIGGVAKGLLYQGGGFAVGQGFESSKEYTIDEDYTKAIVMTNTTDLLVNLNSEYGEFLGDLTTGVVNGVFGEKTKELKDAGIIFGEQTIGQFTSGDIDAQQYQDIETKSSYIAGLIHSSDTNTKYEDLDTSTTDAFVSIMNEGKEVVGRQMELLGLGTYESIMESLDSTELEKLKESFKDKSEQEINDIISGYYGNAFEQMVVQNAEIVERYRQVGEDSSTALARISLGYESATNSLDRLGFGLVEFANIVDNQALAYLNVDTTAYEENFLTEQEKIALQTRDLTKIYENANATLPDTKEGFDDMLHSLDLNTVEGQKLYATMMNTAGAFAQLRDKESRLAEERIKEAEELARVEREGLESIYDSMYAQIDKVDSFEAQIAQNRLDYIEKVADATEEMIATSVDAFQDEIDKLRGYGKSDEQTRFMDLIKFNELDAQYQTLMSQKNVDIDVLNSTRDDLISVSDKLGQADYANDFFRENLIDRLNIDKDLTFSSSTVVQMEMVKLSDEEVKAYAEAKRQRDYLSSIVASDEALLRMQENDTLNYAIEHDLNRQQFDELKKITESGYTTQAKLDELIQATREATSKYMVNAGDNSTTQQSQSTLSLSKGFLTAQGQLIDATSRTATVVAGIARDSMGNQILSGWDAINAQREANANHTRDSSYKTDIDYWKSLDSYEDGGWTGRGSRTGGVDGRGGKVSILHPNEIVMDLLNMPKIPQRQQPMDNEWLQKIYKKLEESEKHHKSTVEELKKVKKENETLKDIQNNLLVLEVAKQ